MGSRAQPLPQPLGPYPGSQLCSTKGVRCRMVRKPSSLNMTSMLPQADQRAKEQATVPLPMGVRLAQEPTHRGSGGVQLLPWSVL